MPKYNPNKIEKKWQRFWEAKNLYEAKDAEKGRENFMLLAEFPYTSGNLHMGHWFTYSIADIYARYMRMNGYNVMYPIGFDAFGLPAENAAIKSGSTPDKWTKQNIRNMTKQLKTIGAAFDWPRVVNTSNPDYYKWTQWIFLKLYEKGLAYRGETMVNWCPKDKTVLANEQVVNGCCERCDTPVEQRKLTQWMFKITSFADALADDLTDLDWPDDTKAAQVNWIGRSTGAEIEFPVRYSSQTHADDTQNNADNTLTSVKVFTTRSDTLFGATYLVLAPEHGLIENLKSKIENWDEVSEYVEKAKRKTELQRKEEVGNKTGVELKGVKAINPATKEEIPVWVADYVLGGYGTGAIMAVPAHDERDFEFAKKFSLPIKPVINARGGSYLVIEKSLTPANVEKLKNYGEVKIEAKDKNWGNFYRVSVSEKDEESLINFLKENLLEESIDGGSWYADSAGTTNRIVFKGKVFNFYENLEKYKEYGRSINIPEEQLDVRYQVYTGEGVLINSGKFSGKESEKAKWEITNFVGGEKKTQYRLRDWILSRQRYWGAPIPMIHCDKCGYVPVPEKDLPVKLPKLDDFLPVEGGKSPLARAEKWVKVKCPKCGGLAERETDTMDTFVDSSWYFIRYTDPKNKNRLAYTEKVNAWLPVPLYIGGREHNTMHLLYARFITKALNKLGVVDFSEPFLSRRNHGVIMGPDSKKMSKSRGNVVDPDVEVKRYGADTVRMNFAFLGPFEQDYAWNPKNINGIDRFLNRVWNLLQRQTTNDKRQKQNQEISR